MCLFAPAPLARGEGGVGSEGVRVCGVEDVKL